DCVSSADNTPASNPTSTQPRIPFIPINSGCSGTGNNGPNPKKNLRHTAAVALATATETKLRGFHSNSSNSTASNTEATGAASSIWLGALAGAGGTGRASATTP